MKYFGANGNIFSTTILQVGKWISNRPAHICMTQKLPAKTSDNPKLLPIP